MHEHNCPICDKTKNTQKYSDEKLVDHFLEIHNIVLDNDIEIDLKAAKQDYRKNQDKILKKVRDVEGLNYIPSSSNDSPKSDPSNKSSSLSSTELEPPSEDSNPDEFLNDNIFVRGIVSAIANLLISRGWS